MYSSVYLNTSVPKYVLLVLSDTDPLLVFGEAGSLSILILSDLNFILDPRISCQIHGDPGNI